MHKQNVIGIVFRGLEGKKAIMQIIRAKPVKNKYTTTVEERSKAFSDATKDFFSKKW